MSTLINRYSITTTNSPKYNSTIYDRTTAQRANTAPASPHVNSSFYYTSNLLAPPHSNTNAISVALPSLRHLQLLPDPKIQEYAYNYPDTSERTPLWKKNLVQWCKETNYQDYVKIVNNLSHERSSIPRCFHTSVDKPVDAFQNLSEQAWEQPMTPPMSPQNTKDTPVVFTPFVSQKLVEVVKGKRYQGQNVLNATTTTTRHRKTNSFKAMQLKKLLDNRDVLSVNSKTNYRINKKRVNVVSTADTMTTATSSTNKASKTIVMKLNSYSTKTNTGNTTPRSTSPTRMAATTPSPVTPPTSKYHRFSIDSPKTPKLVTQKNHNHTTPGSRRRSSGNSPYHQHVLLRKCISCRSSDSPCWRPSWSGRKQDQLCNSCGLRYKKTRTRCLNDLCRKIPTKSELGIMKTNGLVEETLPNGITMQGYKCLFCNSVTETLPSQEKASPIRVDANTTATTSSPPHSHFLVDRTTSDISSLAHSSAPHATVTPINTQ